MANWLTKRISGLDFWDQEENKKQRQQYADEDKEEERRRKREQAARSSTSTSRQVPGAVFEPTLIPEAGATLTKAKPKAQIASQSQFAAPPGKDVMAMLEKPKVVDTRSDGQKEIDKLYEKHRQEAINEEKNNTSWLDRTVTDRDWVKRAENAARNRALLEYQDKVGYNKQPEVLDTMKRVKQTSNELSQNAENFGSRLDNVENRLVKVGQVASYVPVTGSVLNLGLAGTEKLSKGTGNTGYGEDVDNLRKRIDLGMTKEEFDALPEETRKKLNTLETVGLGAAPLDFLGLGGVAKSGIVSAGKKAALETITKKGVSAETKAALKTATVQAGKDAAIPAVAGAGISVGGQAYLGGKDAIDPLQALKDGALVGGASLLFPSAGVRKSVKSGIDPAETPNMPGKVSRNIEVASKPTVEVAPGVKSANLAKGTPDQAMPSNQRPSGDIQMAIEAAHSAGNAAEVDRLITTLPPDMQDPMKSSLGIASAKHATVDPKTGKIVMVDNAPAFERGYGPAAPPPPTPAAAAPPELPAFLQEMQSKLPEGYRVDESMGVYDPNGVELSTAQIQELIQEPFLTEFERASHVSDHATMVRIADEHPDDARVARFVTPAMRAEVAAANPVPLPAAPMLPEADAIQPATLPTVAAATTAAATAARAIGENLNRVNEIPISDVPAYQRGYGSEPVREPTPQDLYNAQQSALRKGDSTAAQTYEGGLDPNNPIDATPAFQRRGEEQSPEIQARIADLEKQLEVMPAEADTQVIIFNLRKKYGDMLRENPENGAAIRAQLDSAINAVKQNASTRSAVEAELDGLKIGVNDNLPPVSAAPSIPDPAAPLALAKAPAEAATPSDAVMAESFKPAKPDNAPLEKAVPVAEPTQTDLAEAAQSGDLRVATEPDAQGNPTRISDDEYNRQLVDAGLAPVRAIVPWRPLQRTWRPGRPELPEKR